MPLSPVTAINSWPREHSDDLKSAMLPRELVPLETLLTGLAMPKAGLSNLNALWHGCFKQHPHQTPEIEMAGNHSPSGFAITSLACRSDDKPGQYAKLHVITCSQPRRRTLIVGQEAIPLHLKQCLADRQITYVDATQRTEAVRAVNDELHAMGANAICAETKNEQNPPTYRHLLKNAFTLSNEEADEAPPRPHDLSDYLTNPELTTLANINFITTHHPESERVVQRRSAEAGYLEAFEREMAEETRRRIPPPVFPSTSLLPSSPAARAVEPMHQVARSSEQEPRNRGVEL